jgi:hypothetical protein
MRRFLCLCFFMTLDFTILSLPTEGKRYSAPPQPLYPTNPLEYKAKRKLSETAAEHVRPDLHHDSCAQHPHPQRRTRRCAETRGSLSHMYSEGKHEDSKYISVKNETWNAMPASSAFCQQLSEVRILAGQSPKHAFKRIQWVTS